MGRRKYKTAEEAIAAQKISQQRYREKKSEYYSDHLKEKYREKHPDCRTYKKRDPTPKYKSRQCQYVEPTKHNRCTRKVRTGEDIVLCWQHINKNSTNLQSPIPDTENQES